MPASPLTVEILSQEQKSHQKYSAFDHSNNMNSSIHDVLIILPYTHVLENVPATLFSLLGICSVHPNREPRQEAVAVVMA